MIQFSTELVLIVACTLVVLSYVYSIISSYIKVPSVLLLMCTGMGARFVAESMGGTSTVPRQLIELLGVVGLILIVFEAGLDLKLGAEKRGLIKRSFYSALSILALSAIAIAALFQVVFHETFVSALVYAIPLSIMSGSMIIPSVRSLQEDKREFLIYEASFSDILGILAFNFVVAGDMLTPGSLGVFGGGIVVSIILSVVISIMLFMILAKSRMHIKFFLVFALLVLLYAMGKMLHLPSLIIVLTFGLMIKNWEMIRIKKLRTLIDIEELERTRSMLVSITAETSFVVRTFFFVIFGYSISLTTLYNTEIMLIGSLIILVLICIRFFYIRFVLHTPVLPDVLFIPRGLITIVLLYKIPEHLRLQSINEEIMFFVILVTGVMLAVGMIVYHLQPQEVLEE